MLGAFGILEVLFYEEVLGKTGKTQERDLQTKKLIEILKDVASGQIADALLPGVSVVVKIYEALIALRGADEEFERLAKQKAEQDKFVGRYLDDYSAALVRWASMARAAADTVAAMHMHTTQSVLEMIKKAEAAEQASH
jgi:hypothetical protein